jgi:hypothetical protein
MCLSTTGLSFPATVINAQSQPKSVSITDCGNLPLHIQNITISSPYFSQTNTCGSTIQINTTCSMTVTFTPLGNLPADSNASLLIANDASYTPRIYLSGVGIPDFSIAPITPTSATATVKAGQTANYALAVTGGTDYSGEVAVNCEQVPANYVCNLSTNFLQVQAGVATDFTISVAPQSPSSSLLPAWPGRMVTAAFALLVSGGLALFSISMRRIPKPFLRALASALICLGLAGTLAGVAGCSANPSGTSAGAPGTPAPNSQTYTLEIVFSDVNVSHTMPITLIVEQ